MLPDLVLCGQQSVEAFGSEIASRRANGDYKGALITAQALIQYLHDEFPEETLEVENAERAAETLEMAIALDDEQRDLLHALDQDPLKLDELMGRANIEVVELITQRLRIREELFGRDHHEYLGELAFLAFIHKRHGNMTQAEGCYRELLNRSQQVFGARHPTHLHYLNNFGPVLAHQGKALEAEGVFREAYMTRREVLGDDDPNTLGSLTNLASHLQIEGCYEKAEPLYLRLLESYTEMFGPENWTTMIVSGNLAQLYMEVSRFKEAEGLLRPVLTAKSRKIGAQSPSTLLTQADLATSLAGQGFFDAALELMRNSWQEHLRQQGESHAQTVDLARRLGALLLSLDRNQEATPILESGVRGFEESRSLAGPTPFDSIAYTDRFSPRLHLCASLVRQGKAKSAFASLESHLARALLESIRERAQLKQESTHPEKRLLAEIQSLDEALPEGALRGIHSGEATRELLSKRNRLLGKLSDIRRQAANELQASASASLETIQGSLDSHAALIAWLSIPKGLDHLMYRWACVVRHQGDPEWIPLPDADPSHGELMEIVRTALADGTLDDTIRSAHAKLRELWFAPLIPSLQGIDHLVVVEPYELTGIPIEVFAEDTTISYTPSATMFSELVSRPHRKQPRSLFAVGDPNFEDGEWPRLPGTRKEIEAIRALFDADSSSHCTLLLGENATEWSVQQYVEEQRLSEFDCIHLATHARSNPRVAWLSALVFPAQSSDPSPMDGRITAQQILRTWNLDALLVCLSACQSAMGKTVSGEGLIGFTQALLAAGSDSVMLSLWNVNDYATALLMSRYYENWLGSRGVPPLNKADSLKEAKHWLRTNSPAQNRTRAHELELLGVPNQDRGQRRSQRAGKDSDVEFDFSHAHYWAAFVLIGDPR